MTSADWPLVGARFALYVALGLSFGLAAFGIYGLRGEERRTAIPLRGWLIGSAAAGLILSTALLVVMAAGMAGVAPPDVDRETVAMLATAPGVGAAWLARTAALALVLAAAAWAASASSLAIAAVAAGVALGSLAWNGHAAAGEGAAGWLHLGADILHLLAAGLWVGALAALMLLVARPAARVTDAHLVLSHRALHGFSRVGTIVVGLLLATGLAGSRVLVGPENMGELGGSLYGRLLLAKLALFGAMLGLAGLNRFRLTPAFSRALAAGDARAALARLRRSLAVETLCAIVILALVAWLGTLAPPASGI